MSASCRLTTRPQSCLLGLFSVIREQSFPLQEALAWRTQCNPPDIRCAETLPDSCVRIAPTGPGNVFLVVHIRSAQIPVIQELRPLRGRPVCATLGFRLFLRRWL